MNEMHSESLTQLEIFYMFNQDLIFLIYSFRFLTRFLPSIWFRKKSLDRIAI